MICPKFWVIRIQSLGFYIKSKLFIFSVETLQAQMFEMQKQMMLMQKQLEEKNLQLISQKSSNDGNSAVIENQASLSSKDLKQTKRPSLKETDLFSQPNSSSKICPKSPMKTNPFAEGIDRPVKFTSAKVRGILHSV